MISDAILFISLFILIGNLSHVFPMNWRFLTTLDPQVDIAFSRDLDSSVRQREMDAVKQFLESSKVIHIN